MNVSDWLGENNKLGIDIWEKKYRHNNETFDEWLDRVSCGDDKLKDVIINKEFLFGGRILSNRGLFKDGTKVTYSNCFTAGHNVITNRGIKKIEDVVVGDMVLSHDLTYNRVNEVLSHVHSGNLITLTINGVENAITCTPNHQFLTFEAGWVEAQNLTFDHHVLLANRKEDDYNSYNDIVSISVSQDAVELVYNLSVENTHTYNVNGVVVHNCYVISPPEDNIESIFECASKLARTYSFGGGCGVDIGKLAPRGAKVHNTAKETSGAVSFMDLYSLVTGLIGQNGRRGALMLSMPCNHPDIEEFIEVKSDLDRVTKANISIRITDDFIEAVKQDKPYRLSFTRKETGETIEKVVNAKKLFEKLAEMNWDYAEPGCLFWDRIEKYNLLGEDSEFEYAGTNPCAEEPLPAGGSCLLGSINLSAFVTENKLFNYSRFIEVVRTSVRALNDVLDEGLPLHPLKEQQDSVRDWRQIGLGIMGLADMLIKLEIPYGSKDSFSICDEIGRIMAVTAIDESSKIAKEQGKYPKYKEVVRNSEFYKYHIDNSETKETDEHVKKYGIRNSQLLTIAPTGTLSTMLQISGGIEPIFANFYERTTQSLHGKDVVYKVYTKIVEDYMKEHGITDDKDLPEWFVTAQTLDYRNRIEMQSVWQSHIDASISSTVNVPNSFTKEQTFDLYMYAHDMGLKGVTIFRDGCKRTAILNTSSKKEDSKPSELSRGVIIDVSDNVIGKKRKLMTGCGSLHCEAFFDPDTGELLETYLSKGSTGGCNNFMIGLSRMISLSARSGCDIHSIVDQLNSCGACPSYAVRRATKGDTSKGSCCPMAVGNALIDMYNELQDELGLSDERLPQQNEIGETTITNIASVKAKCPECGETLTFEGGCNICKNCGWSKCG